MKIGQVIFWFRIDGENQYPMTKINMGLSYLLQKLLNECYDGKPIQFINFYFYDRESFIKHEGVKDGYIQYTGPALTSWILLEMDEYLLLTREEQHELIWQKAYKYLKAAAPLRKNTALLNACEKVYNEGVKSNYNTDILGIQADLLLFNKVISANITFKFDEEYSHAFLVLKNRNGKVVLEREVYKTAVDNSYFLSCWREIVSAGNIVILQGAKNAGFFPVIVSLSESELIE